MVPVRMAMRKHTWLLIGLISFILIQSCILNASSSVSSSSDEWAMFRNDPSRSGYAVITSSASSVKLLWASETHKGISSSPAVAEGYVFAGCNYGILYCFNASNGELLWYFLTGKEMIASPAIYRGYVYAGSDDGYLYCLDIATGTPVWMCEVGGLVRSSPAIAEGRIYIGSGNHDVLCLNASDGAEIWRYPTSQRVQSSPAVSDGVVYVASDDFFVYAVNASTGDELWRTHTGSVISSPSVHDGSVYIGSTDGYICALNASTGAKNWEYLTGGSVSSSPIVAYGYVYVGSDDNNVYCLNATDGENIWQYPTGYWVRSSPAVADGNVYVGSEDYNIYCLDAFTGEKQWSYETGSYVDSSPAIASATLYVGSSDHHVYAFSLGDSADALPPQSNSLPLTTIVFDAVACAVAATAVFAVVYFVRLNGATDQSEDVKFSGQKRSWFLEHTDILCVLAILAFSILFFLNLGSSPLWVADEQTYSQWAFHMFKSGDYMTPWAFGDLLLWIGKPPLFMWLMSLAFQVFGVTNFAARFWSAVFGTLSLILVFYLGKKLYNVQVGLVSALVLGTFTTFYLFARHAMLDVTFVFFMLASIYFLTLGEKKEGVNRYVALGGLFFGLAFMTKQVAAFLIPIIVFVYFAATGRGVRFLFKKRFALFWILGLLIVAPWMIYMALSFQDFWQSFFVFSGIMRASTPIEGHVGGPLFYFNYLINNENLFWVTLLPFSAGLCLFNAVFKRLKADTLVFAWMAIVLVLFTLIQTKLEWYILPAFPAFALAIGSFLYQLSKKIGHAMRLLASQALKIVEIASSRKQRAKHYS